MDANVISLWEKRFFFLNIIFDYFLKHFRALLNLVRNKENKMFEKDDNMSTTSLKMSLCLIFLMYV